MKKGNRFDNLIIDVPKLFLKFPISGLKTETGGKKFNSVINSLYGFKWLPLVIRKYLWYFFKRTGIDQIWFEEFRTYWGKYLGGITLWGVEDFYFLRGIYRQKFHNLELPDKSSSKSYLNIWQKPEVLFFLLDQIYRGKLYNELSNVDLYLKYRTETTLPILEFGCATAPIASSLIEFFGLTDQKIYISDIQTLAFHYGAYKFRKHKNVTPVLLDPKDGFTPKSPEKLGAIFCLTVFEHVNEPLSVAKKFYDLLAPGGLLIFDYLKTDGKGLDSSNSVKARGKTLEYIGKNFKVIHGDLHKTTGSDVIVAVKN